MIENNPFEPIENLTIRKSISTDLLKDKIFTTCNFDYDGELQVLDYPLAWAHETPAVIKPIKFDHKPKKKFITLNWAKNNFRVKWFSFIKNRLDDGYYNFKFYNLTNLKKAERWHTLPKEYFNCIWEFGIESGKDFPFKCITEKTYRPLYLCKPFLVYGHPGLYKKLNQLGFTLSPHIDYSFDTDTPYRWDAFCAEVTRLLDENPQQHIMHSRINKIEFDNILKNTRKEFEDWLCTNTKI